MRILYRLPLTAVAILAMALLGVVGINAVAGANRAQATTTTALTFFPLNLAHGWTNAPFATRNAAVAKDSFGIVHLEGAIATTSTNTNNNPFLLPPAARPAKGVYVAVDMCNGAAGRLFIPPSGQVAVQTQTASDATCFTSLEGVTYAQP